MAKQWRYVREIPYAKPPAEKTKKRKAWEPRQVFTAHVSMTDDKLLHLAVHLAFVCSLRAGETVGIDARKVDFHDRSFWIAQEVQRVSDTALAVIPKNEIIRIFPKTIPSAKSSLILKGPKTEGSVRKQYLTTPLLLEIKERLDQIRSNKEFFGKEYHDYGLLICQPDGKPIDPKSLNKSFKKWQSEMNIEDQIEFQGLRKSGQMHKVRLSKNNYQLVAENSGQSPEVLMSNYNEALESEKRTLSLMVETSFYPQTSTAGVKTPTAGLEMDAVLQAIQNNPELSKQILQTLLLGAVHAQQDITDVKRQTTKSEPSYYNYLTYTTLFPQIIAGPIVRYVTVENELENRALRADNAVAGLKRFLLGLGKKVLLANNVGLLWEEAQSAGAARGSVLLSWLGITAFAFQIYFDFSGYSDMAIGLARISGLYFDENFDYPYISKSITEFWRRWHITLGAWFRDYVYIPLGGNRKGKFAQLRNILVVWGLTGLWHGASWNFLFWGLYFGVLLTAEKFLYGRLLQKLPAVFSHLYTCFFVLIGFVLFSFEDLGQMGAYLAGLFGANRAPLWNAAALYYLRNYAAVLAVSTASATPVFKKLAARARGLRAADALALGGYAVLFLLTVAYLVNSTYNPFLYFRF